MDFIDLHNPLDLDAIRETLDAPEWPEPQEMANIISDLIGYAERLEEILVKATE